MDVWSGKERDIEVRSLMGDSIRVSVEPNKTVQALKLRLKQCFSPAASSPDFHLFFKGVKLDYQSEISSYLIGDGEFLVVVPFVKKDRQHRLRVESSETANQDLNHNDRLRNQLAESAWSDLMQDLSCLKDMSNRGSLDGTELNSKNSENENASDRINLSRKTNQKNVFNNKERPSFDAVLNMLQKSGDDRLDEQSLQVLLQYIDSSSCLNDQTVGCCVMRKADALVGRNLDAPNSRSCLCPLWLKDLMRAFSFVNVYCACLQMWHKQITISAVKEPLEQLHKLGLHPGIVNLELLSQVCPQVILIVEKEEETTKSPHALVITKSPVVEAGKRLTRSKVVSSMKKREISFRAIIYEAAKSLMLKNGAETVESFSLEDLMDFVKTKDFESVEREVKQERPKSCASSSSHSYEVHCHETNSLLPEEMVRHLKSNLGSRGQVVHIEELSGRHAKYVEIPTQLSENVKFALRRVGITRLYSHQAKSIQDSLAGKNMIVATMTSSGKSLCYNIPVLEILSCDPLACAMYLFPTKALAQDQMRALLSISNGIDDSLNIGIYDGDTSQEDRLWLRDNARLFITNPDMLHVSILPFHGQFRRILSNLRQIYCY